MPEYACNRLSTVLDGAQRDMRDAYYCGAPGIAISGLVWLVASIVAVVATPTTAMLTLFVGGAAIHPLAVLLSKVLGRSGAPSAGNPLARSAIEGTLWFVACLPLAYAASLVRIDWFFPAMMLLIGGRYLGFTTLYGLRLYWLLGGALLIGAFVSVRMQAAFAVAPTVAALIELLFAVAAFRAGRGERRDTAATV